MEGGDATGIQWVEARGAAKPGLACTGERFTAKNDLAPNVRRAKIEKPWFSGR